MIKYPNPTKFQRATKKGLIGFLKIHKIGISPKWQERIERRNDGPGWRFDSATSRAKEFLVVSLAKQLVRLEATLKSYRKLIDKLFKDQPDADLFLSLPGAGPKLASSSARIQEHDAPFRLLQHAVLRLGEGFLRSCQREGAGARAGFKKHT